MATLHDIGPPPRPGWRSAEGAVIDPGQVRSDSVEIDLRDDEPVVRLQHPTIDHPWAENWPTWIGLSVARD